MGTVLLLLVLRPGPSPEVLTAARAALAQILGSRVALVVEAAPSSLSDPQIIELQAKDHADLAAAVEVVQEDVLRVSVRRTGEPVPTRHTLAFEASDAASERGRALGYAIASMLPPVWLEASARERQLAPLAAPRWSFALAPEGALGLGARAAPYGGRIAVDWFSRSRWGIEALASYRFGTLEAAASTYSHALAAAGLVVRLREPEPGKRGWGALARLAVGLARHEADHFDTDERDKDTGPVHRTAWMAGAILGAEADWWFSASAAVLASVDVEGDAGAVDVYMKDKHVGTLGPVSAVAALGLRIRY